MNLNQLIISFFIASISTFLLVYPVKKIAYKYGFLDQPSKRKVHKHATPRIGGVAIFFGALLGLIYLRPSHPSMWAIILGGIIIVVVGLIDDKYQIRPIVKLIGQIIAALVVINGDVIISKITLPFIGMIEFNHVFAMFITLLWVVGVTNAINLIDGLDGLASGVTTIGLISILVMAIMDGNVIVIYLATVLIASNIGFLFHNFYPATIYMGDTGAMFLGYSIAVISTLGLFKNVTIFSFIIPIIILAIPIFDTLFSIVRRMLNGENILSPDKKHIHHRLLEAGFSHRATVLIIYGFSALFGLIAVIFTKASLIVTVLLSIALLLILQAFAELVGAVRKEKTLLLKMVRQTQRNEKGKQ